MLSGEDVAQLTHRLQIHRRNLALYLDQYATFSAAHVPPHVVTGIREEREQIAFIKTALRTAQVSVADHPDDEAAQQNEHASLVGVPPMPPNSSQRNGMPFAPSRPLQPPEPIFGRDDLIAQIVRHLRDGHSINVVAAKAMGKTTLLNYLIASDGPLANSLIVWTWLNLDFIHNSEQFYAAAAHELLAALPAAQRQLPHIADLMHTSQHSQRANAQILRHVLAAFAQLQPPRVPLLVVDNFENLLRPTSSADFHFPDFFNDLREMRQHRGLLMIVASDKRVEAYCTTDRRDGLTSSFHDGLMICQLLPLDRPAAEALLLQPGRHHLTNAEVRAACTWAAGSPRNLQVAGIALYRARDEGKGVDAAHTYYREQVPAPAAAPTNTIGGRLRQIVGLPRHIGRSIGKIGGYLDGLGAWVGGAIFLLLLLLVMIGAIPFELALNWFRDLIGIGGM